MCYLIDVYYCDFQKREERQQEMNAKQELLAEERRKTLERLKQYRMVRTNKSDADSGILEILFNPLQIWNLEFCFSSPLLRLSHD